MIRYVSEKEVDINSPRKLKQHRSQQKSTELKPKAVEVPEQGEKSTYALRILKKANDQSETLKGRLSVLQIHEEKNDFKAFLNDQRYRFHQQMRDEMEREREEKAAHLRKVMQKLNQTQEQARQERIQHEMNLKRAQDELYNSKANDYKMTKDRRDEIERSINQYRQKEEERKKQRNQQIREYERTQKSHVSQYFNSKKTQFYREDSKESMKMSRVYEERKKQIEELSKMELLMIERQARSKMSSEESQNKLKGLLVPSKKAVSTSHTAKLPALNGAEKRTNSEQDILII